MSANNGTGGAIIIATQLPQRGTNAHLFANMSAKMNYQTPFRTFSQATAPFGQVMRRVVTNNSWNSSFDVEYPLQCDMVAETFIQTTLPALVKANLPGVNFDLFYTFNVGAAMVQRLELEPKGSHTMERFDRFAIETHRALMQLNDRQMPQASYLSEDVQHLIDQSAAAQEMWCPLPLFHSVERALAFPVSAAGGTQGVLHVIIAAQDDVCQALPAAGSAVYGGTTPWATNTIAVNFWFMTINITPQELDDILATEQTTVYSHFLNPASVAVATVAQGATNTQTVDIPWHAALRYFTVVYVATTRLSTHHDVFNFQGAGTDAVPIDPIQSIEIEADGQPLSAQHNALYFREVQPSLYAKNVPNKFIYFYSFGGRLDNQVPEGPFQTVYTKNVRLHITFQGHPTDATAGIPIPPAVVGTGALPAGRLYLVGHAWNVHEVKRHAIAPLFSQ